jgi:hypothetical protein
MNQNFWKHVNKTDSCWLWTGYKMATGYGHFMDKQYKGSQPGKCWLVHRYAYANLKGEIPPGLIVRHLCNVKACVNPDHLELGTHQDNMADIRKGRDEGYEAWLGTSMTREGGGGG